MLLTTVAVRSPWCVGLAGALCMALAGPPPSSRAATVTLPGPRRSQLVLRVPAHAGRAHDLAGKPTRIGVRLDVRWPRYDSCDSRLNR